MSGRRALAAVGALALAIPAGVAARPRAANPNDELLSAQDASAGGGVSDSAVREVTVARGGAVAAFVTDAQTLAPGDPDGFNDDVFVHSRADGHTAEISAPGPLVGGVSFDPALSADGRWLVFTTAPFGPPAPAFAPGTVVLVDLQSGRRRVAATHAEPYAAPGPPAPSRVSDNGATVVLAGIGRRRTVRVYHRATGRTRTIASVGRNSFVSGLSVSGNGRVVAWSVFHDPRGGRAARVTVYRRVLSARHTTVVDREWSGTSLVGRGIYGTALSRSGRLLAYVDRPFNTRGGREGAPDVRLYDARTHRSRVISRTVGGRPAEGLDPSISDDGHRVGWTGSQTDPRSEVALGVVTDVRRARSRAVAKGAAFTLAADGRSFAYLAAPPAGGAYQAWLGRL